MAYNSEFELPGVRYREIDETITPTAPVSANKIGFAGKFKKGYIGVGIDVKNRNELNKLFGEGSASENIQDWHAADKLLDASTVVLSRAFNNGTTKSSFFNMSLDSKKYTYTLELERSTLINVTDTMTFDIDVDGDTTSDLSVRLQKQYLNDDGKLVVVVSGDSEVAIIDGISKLMVTDGLTTYITINDSQVDDPVNISKSTFKDSSFSKSTDDKFYIDIDGNTQPEIIGDEDASNLAWYSTSDPKEIKVQLEGSISFDDDIVLTTATSLQGVVELINTAVGVDIATVHLNKYLRLVSDNIGTDSSITIDNADANDCLADFFDSATKTATGQNISNDSEVDFIKTSQASNGLNTLYFKTNETLTITPNTSKIVQLNSSDEFVSSNLILTNSNVDNQEISYPITFTSTSQNYGTATDIYDILDKNFETNLKNNTDLKDIFIVANSPGKWGNKTTVELYGSNKVNNDNDYLKLINFRELNDNEILLLISNSDDNINEKYIVSLDDTAKDENNQFYFIKNVTVKNSQLISIYINLSDKIASNFDYSVLLENGADGTIDEDDIAVAYNVFSDKKYDTPLIVTGNGSYTADQLEAINQSISLNVLDKIIDRYGIFNLPLSLIQSTDPITQIKSWFDDGSWKITSTYHKYETETTFFTVPNVYGGDDIILPMSILVCTNFVQTFDSFGREQAVFGDNYGVIGNYKECLWVPADDTEANDLYVRRLNPIQESSGSLIKNGQKTGLNKTSSSNRANVRLKQNEVESTITSLVSGYVAESNDAKAWDKLRTTVNNELQDIKDDEGINDFEVQCDEGNNDTSLTDIYVTVGIDYKKAIERIFVTFVNKSLSN